MDWRLKLFLFAAGGFVLALMPGWLWLALAAFVAAAIFAGALAFSVWAVAHTIGGFLRALRARYGEKEA
jgi:hypothetical protein